jgi:chromosome segregation ATPase
MRRRPDEDPIGHLQTKNANLTRQLKALQTENGRLKSRNTLLCERLRECHKAQNDLTDELNRADQEMAQLKKRVQSFELSEKNLLAIKQKLMNKCGEIKTVNEQYRGIIGQAVSLIRRLREEMDNAKIIMRTWIGEEGTTGSFVDQMCADLRASQEDYQTLLQQYEALAATQT